METEELVGRGGPVGEQRLDVLDLLFHGGVGLEASSSEDHDDAIMALFNQSGGEQVISVHPVLGHIYVRMVVRADVQFDGGMNRAEKRKFS